MTDARVGSEPGATGARRTRSRRIAVVPAYNEASTIAAVLDELHRHVDELIVVDDGSTDGTRAEIDRWLPGHERVQVLVHETNQGMSEAYLLALTTLRERLQQGELSADDLVFTVDADGQHDLAVLDELVEITIAEGLDAMLARRDLSYQSAYKRAGNAVVSAWASLWAGRRLHDVESGYRIFRLGSLAHALDFYRGYRYSETVEVAVVMSRLGYRVRNDHVVEVPVARSRTRLSDALIDVAVIPLAAVRVFRTEPSDDVRGGGIALLVVAAAWLLVAARYLAHGIVLSSDSMNNYVHVWWVARDLWHHAQLPWHMPVLGHGDAYAYPYGFTNWTFAAMLWPAFGNWAVTLCSVVGVAGCIAATFVAFPELRRGWWAAAALANPAIIEALLFGQQAFAWGAALLLFGIAAWRRNRPLLAAVLVGLGQATHAAIVLPIGVLLVAVACFFVTDRRRLLRWYGVALLITLPAVVLVLASPGYADATMRDKLVNFGSTLAPRLLIVLLPIVFVWARNLRIRALAPIALIVSLGINVAFQYPLNVDFQWDALSREVSTASLDHYLSSPQFVPGATYRVLRGAGDGKLGLYHVVRAGGRLDSEMFPESMAIRSFPNLHDYDELLCRRHVDYVIAYGSYTASRRTNELALLSELAQRDDGPVRAKPIESGLGHIVYRISRPGCPVSSRLSSSARGSHA
jgi:glycosyltransferase involved in cell wall biosynthesis